jgi:hypothetical protein
VTTLVLGLRVRPRETSERENKELDSADFRNGTRCTAVLGLVLYSPREWTQGDHDPCRARPRGIPAAVDRPAQILALSRWRALRANRGCAVRIVLDTVWVPCGSRDGVDQREHVAGQMPPVDGVEQVERCRGWCTQRRRSQRQLPGLGPLPNRRRIPAGPVWGPGTEHHRDIDICCQQGCSIQGRRAFIQPSTQTSQRK